MATYKVWLDGRKTETATLVEAKTSFNARQWLAIQYGAKTYQIIAIKQHRDAAPCEAVNDA